MEMWERRTEQDIDELVRTKVLESIEIEYKQSPALGNTDGKKNAQRRVEESYPDNDEEKLCPVSEQTNLALTLS